jgi:CDP-diacylglycerol--glycerol-3-phosphate 3-phosphatidyltransferase/cardiolipin synthase
MLNKSQIPNVLSVIRFIAAPIFFYAFLNNLFSIYVATLAIAAITDILDGYVARKTGSITNLGSYLDVTADFALIIISFLAFVIKGWYDPLILVLITIMFILFITTSDPKKPVYDPVGKYLGTYLMLMIFISILLPLTSWRDVLLIILVILCMITIISRLYFWRKKCIKKN